MEVEESYLPRNVGLPAAPGFTEVLQNCSGLVLFDAFRHHVQNVMHHGCPKLKVKVRLYSLLCYCLRHAL